MTFKADDVIMHAQRITGNGILTVPHHNFEHLSHWYYLVQEIKNYEFGILSNGMTALPDFMKICPTML
jgi:hypothetical protein